MATRSILFQCQFFATEGNNKTHTPTRAPIHTPTRKNIFTHAHTHTPLNMEWICGVERDNEIYLL